MYGWVILTSKYILHTSCFNRGVIESTPPSLKLGMRSEDTYDEENLWSIDMLIVHGCSTSSSKVLQSQKTIYTSCTWGYIYM